MLKICKKCQVEKEIRFYPLKSNGKPKSSYCKECYNIVYYQDKKEDINKKRSIDYKINAEKTSNERKVYYHENKEEINKKRREYYQLNKSKHSKDRKNYYECNKEKIKEKSRKYYQDNKDDINDKRKDENRERALIYYYKNKNVQNKKSAESKKTKIANDPLFKLTHNIRVLIRRSMKNQFTTKSKKTIEILGCSFIEFKFHLESQFDDKMNWDNQGTYWHMDHIIPISSAKEEEDVYRLNHYTNFQPLYWFDNLKKSNKI